MGGRLENKIALITGAASGIGAESARVFAAEGAKVALADRNMNLLNTVVQEITDEGGEAIAVEVDLSDQEQIKNMVQSTVDAFGGLDVLYSNAGISGRGLLAEADSDDFDKVIAVNLRGGFLCSKYAVPEMQKRGGGSVIFTASELALVGSPGGAIYCASKAGLIGMCRALALDHAAEGIRFNCICPGAVDTPMLWGEEKGDRAEVEADIVSRMPLGRVGRPNEIARSALYLASDDASFVTGTSLVVDGGWTTR